MNPIDPSSSAPTAAAPRKPSRRVATIILDGPTFEICGSHRPNVARLALELLWRDAQHAQRPWRGAVPHVPIAKAVARVSVSVPGELVAHLDARCAETGAASGDVLLGLLSAYRRRVARMGALSVQLVSSPLPPSKRGRWRPWRTPRHRTE